jgi:hypothetical protein
MFHLEPTPSSLKDFIQNYQINACFLFVLFLGINASGLLGQNKGPVEMDVDDLNDNEKESLRNQG